MAKFHSSKFWGSILILITSILSDGFVVDARSDIPNGTLKTMKLKNGNVIALISTNNPHLVILFSRITQYSSNPTDQLGVNAKIEPLENMFEACQCPEGTIPMIRNQSNFTAPIESDQLSEIVFTDTPNHEYAEVSIIDIPIFGAQAFINVWNPHVELKNEASRAHISVIGGYDKSKEIITAGWTVRTIDNVPRFYIYWKDTLELLLF
ncbi:hypothetical protein ACFE04_003772 [Oxalis oulophora]